jgi:N6-L-threonylcarbamoyladenine synthase
MNILGIETSCDETAAAVVEDGRRIRSSVVASQVRVHRAYGGVVPELASREHVDNICYVVQRALQEAALSWEEVDGIAVTRGPGLVGALLVGLTYAKALAFARGLPFVGVNHLEGHLHSVFLEHPEAPVPALSLVVSGGHTNLYFLAEDRRDYRLLARTRDDAAGEALDKLAKFLGLGYPGGPVIERLASQGDPRSVSFAVPRFSDGSLDFSYSGLKTAALRHARSLKLAFPLDPAQLPAEVLDLAASYQQAVIDQLIDRLEKALEQVQVNAIHVSGGVSCNSALRAALEQHFAPAGLPVLFPRPALTTDNAAMIAGAAYPRLSRGERDGWRLTAEAVLTLGDGG